MNSILSEKMAIHDKIDRCLFMQSWFSLNCLWEYSRLALILRSNWTIWPHKPCKRMCSVELIRYFLKKMEIHDKIGRCLCLQSWFSLFCPRKYTRLALFFSRNWTIWPHKPCKMMCSVHTNHYFVTKVEIHHLLGLCLCMPSDFLWVVNESRSRLASFLPRYCAIWPPQTM